MLPAAKTPAPGFLVIRYRLWGGSPPFKAEICNFVKISDGWGVSGVLMLRLISL